MDGPRGPRGHVHKGVAVMARTCDAAILLMVPVPTRRWVISRSWDRLQIPLPFSRIDGYFAQPIFPQEDETAEQLRQRIENSLQDLEHKHDPQEARFNADSQAELKAD
ncbi:MAG: hypothetical protein IT423_06680 [Pirellulaceae bacterium]|nr:hypothetical protein [Pirellulaceae bacterium]